MLACGQRVNSRVKLNTYPGKFRPVSKLIERFLTSPTIRFQMINIRIQTTQSRNPSLSVFNIKGKLSFSWGVQKNFLYQKISVIYISKYKFFNEDCHAKFLAMLS